MELFSRAGESLRNEGFLSTLKGGLRYLHIRYIRKYLPRRRETLNGTIVRSRRRFDRVVPWETGHPEPKQYESATVDNLREHVKGGDSVTIIGSGWGVTTVVAAQQSGDKGSVRAFEASEEYTRYAEETAKLNGVANRVEITNAVVSHTVSTKGETETDAIVEPGDLPHCDILEMDCEGAELDILKELTIRPRVIIVESHGMFGSPTQEIIEELESLSYTIESQQPAEGGAMEDACRENDIWVITAVLDR